MAKKRYVTITNEDGSKSSHKETIRTQGGCASCIGLAFVLALAASALIAGFHWLAHTF